MAMKLLHLGTTFTEIPINPPCECGDPNAAWHGDPHGLRVYLCDACWAWLTEEETTVTPDTTCNQTNKETTP